MSNVVLSDPIRGRGRWKRKPTLSPAAAVVVKANPPADPIAFINRLTHTKGKHATERFNLRPWQIKIVKKLFTKERGGLRRYRTCLFTIPRKNGKSELAAALAIYFLLADGETGAEVYSAAADRDQASIVFGVAAQMIRNDPELAAQCYIVDSRKRIEHHASGSVYRAISAEAYSKHGLNASAVIYDELASAPSRDLWDVLSTSQGARTQPIMLAISTAGYDRHSILWELYNHARNVKTRPNLDRSFLPVIYEAPESADWLDEKVWYKSNPALGDFRSLEDMRILAARAKEIPAQENTFRRLYLNQWTEQASRWITMSAWDACEVAPKVNGHHPYLAPETEPGIRVNLRGRKCYVGMDLSTTTDLSAIVAVFPDAEGFDVLPFFFVPEERIRERSRRDHVPYDEWARQGYLKATPGAVVDYDAIRKLLSAWNAAYKVEMLGFDPWNATDLTTRLQEQDGFVCVPIRQGFASLSAPTKALEQLVLSRRLRHDGHPLLRWNVANVSVESDPAGNLKPSKTRSTEKIDGVVALIMAVDVMNRQAAIVPPSYAMVIV